MKNTGSSTWGSRYQLVFRRGHRLGAPEAVSVPSTSPGQEVNISVPLQIPSDLAPNSYTGYWQLRNPQGTYFGPEIWVTVKILSANSGGGHITLFDISPASPSSASTVHVVGRIRAFPEFRSMRFVLGNEVKEGTNFRSVGGDQYEISADWNTATLARGDYTLAFEVANIGDPDWARPERQVKMYTLTGDPAPSGRAPDRPILKEPYNWYLKDAAGSSAPVRMCVYPTSDPDGDAVQYYFELNNGAQNSGWTTSTCWEPTLQPGLYSWRVKAGDGSNQSDWSQDTWNFSVATGDVSIGDPVVYLPNDPDNTHICVLVTYGGIQAPEVWGYINTANDGSENGEWIVLDHYGPNTTPDCTQSNVHGFWIRSANYTTGPHVIRISAFKRDSGASATRKFTHTIPYMRPPAPRAIAPSTWDNNGTWWNTRAIAFQWGSALRADSYQLRVSQNSDIWNDPAPLVSVSLGSSTTSYTHPFSQDYDRLYWSVRASNSAGSADSGLGIWFGIDKVTPSCTVQTLPATTPENVFQVNWSGSDNSAGVRSFDIQYLDSRGDTWRDWQLSVPVSKTYDLFTGQPGHSYEFRCRATDKAGNTPDNYPANADTSIRVDPTTRPQTPWWDPSWAWKRNLTIQNNMPGIALPAGYPVRLHFDGATSPTAAEIYNASQSSPKCDDLRIVYNDTTELDRIVKNCSSSAIDIWLRTQVSIPGGDSNSTAHQLYYGNTGAGAPPADERQVWPPPSDGNTVGLWYLSEGSGSTSADFSGYGNNVTSIGTLSWVDGKFGKALSYSDPYSGPPGAFVPGNASMSSSAFTFEALLKRAEVGAGISYIAGQGESNFDRERWLLSWHGGHLTLQVWLGAGAGGSEVSTESDFLADTNWHHVAVTFDGYQTVKFYRDGALIQSRTLSQSGINSSNFDLYIGSGFQPSAERFYGTIDQVRFSNIVRDSFPHGVFATITNEPTLAAGTPIAPPVAGSPDLVVQGLNAYPYPEGGTLVEAVVQNQGSVNTQNGFFTDLYLNNVPTGAGYYTGTVQFWVNDPISAGAAITLTTVITNLGGLGGQGALAVTPAAETTGTLYAQTDSTGAVGEPDNANNIYSAGAEICVASADAYEDDDSAGAAKPIGLGQTQTRNFSSQSDQDWVKFTAEAGITYTVSTSNLGVSADTYLYLYGTDGATLLASNDDYGGSLASQIEWTAQANGTYYILVKHWNPNVGGCGTTYNLRVSLTSSNKLFLPFVRR